MIYNIKKFFKPKYRIKQVNGYGWKPIYYAQFRNWCSPFWRSCEVSYEAYGFDIQDVPITYDTYKDALEVVKRTKDKHKGNCNVYYYI